MWSFEDLEVRRHLSVVNAYTQTNLVSDGATPAATTDTNLVNPWGLAAIPHGPFWVADNGKGVTTAYIGSTIVPPTVAFPMGSAQLTPAPTGVVANTTRQFKIGSGTAARPAEYVFVGEDGTVTAWQPLVDLNNTLLEVDNSASGAVYKGVTMAGFRGKQYLYAANFHAGSIDVFNSSFQAATLPGGGSFSDPTIPAGFAPFNVAAIQGKIFVSYALQDVNKHDDVPGAGNGYIDEFTTGGKFIKRFASQGTLNSPWAMVQAPGSFGKFHNDILVGNFGDGTINAFKAGKGTLDGQLEDGKGAVIAINGLWGLSFGNGTDGKRSSLFFAAGTNDEADGLFGEIDFNKHPTLGSSGGTGGTGGWNY